MPQAKHLVIRTGIEVFIKNGMFRMDGISEVINELTINVVLGSVVLGELYVRADVKQSADGEADIVVEVEQVFPSLLKEKGPQVVLVVF